MKAFRRPIIKYFFLLPILFYVFHFLFFWMYETTDSYFYWAFAQFLRTGTYFLPHPYNRTSPSTIEPPLYSFIIYILDFLPRAEIFMHLIHILSLLASAFLLYLILKKYMGKHLSMIVASIFTLLPVNIIQTSSMMSESLAMLFLTAFIYLSFLIIEQKKMQCLKFLPLISAVSILLRFNFLILFVISIILLVLLKRINKENIVFITISFLVIFSWIIFNHKITGAWGLSNSEGKHLYDRVVGGDKLLPDEDNKDFVRLRTIAGPDVNLLAPWWEIEPYIIDEIPNETDESHLFFNVAFAALMKNPLTYIKNTFINFFIIHGNGIVYPIDIYTTNNRWMGTNCRSLGNFNFCSPIIQAELAKKTWNSLVFWSDKYYYNIPAFINIFLLYPALIYAILSKSKFMKFASITYILCVFISLAAEVPVYRFLYPLFPIKILLIIFFINKVTLKIIRTIY